MDVTDDLTITWLGEPVSMTIAGEVDPDTREQFKAALAQTAEMVNDVQLHLRDVTFMDTHAVTAVVNAANRLQRNGGRLIVYDPPYSLTRIFETLWGSDSGNGLHIHGRR